MQIVSSGDNLHNDKMSKSIFWEKQTNIINLSSTKSVKKLLKVKFLQTWSE